MHVLYMQAKYMHEKKMRLQASVYGIIFNALMLHSLKDKLFEIILFHQ